MIIVVPGAGIDKKGNISEEGKRRLLKAKELHRTYQHPFLLCGKYSFLYGKDHPSTTESEAMRSFLIKEGVSKEHIHIENESEDSVSNAYYAKVRYFMPEKETEALIVSSDFHLERVRYIFNKVFGKEYDLKFVSVPSLNTDKKIIERQKELINKTKLMMQDVDDGDHEAVKKKLYKDDYYKQKRPEWAKKFASRGKI